MGERLRGALGILLGAIAWLWLRSLRLTVLVDPALAAGDPRPWVLAFWHGEQFALLAWRRRRRTVALVSLSNDGQIQARALGVLGLAVERGSTSRGGARGLVAVVRRLRGGLDAAFAVDGPRGPLHRPAPGAIAAARSAGARLVPMGSAARPARVLESTWDRFALPAPFARAVVVLGAPVDPDACDPDVLARAIDAASALAASTARMVGSAPACGTSSPSESATPRASESSR